MADAKKKPGALVYGRTATLNNQEVLVDPDGTVHVTGTFSSGLSLPSWDYMSLAQNATQDIYTFKTGGSGGTTVATVTITFTDAGKGTISTVAKT